MCEENGQKDGDMLGSKGPLQSTSPSKVDSDNTVVCYGNKLAFPSSKFFQDVSRKLLQNFPVEEVPHPVVRVLMSWLVLVVGLVEKCQTH